LKSSRKESDISRNSNFSSNNVNKCSFISKNINNYILNDNWTNQNNLKSLTEVNNKININSTKIEAFNKENDGLYNIQKNLVLLEKKIFKEEALKSEKIIDLSSFNNLLEIKIKTNEGKTANFKLDRQCLEEPESLKINLVEFLEKANINKELYLPILFKINESIFSLNNILEKKIPNSFLEEMVKKCESEMYNWEYNGKDNKELEKLLNKKSIVKEKSENINMIGDNKFKNSEKLSFFYYRTSVSTCQSEDEDDIYDLLLNKTL